MRSSVVFLFILVSSTASPAIAREGRVGISVLGSLGWLEPAATLASPNPRFVAASRGGRLQAGPFAGVRVLIRLSAPIPHLRFTAQRLLGSELMVDGPGARESLGSASVGEGSWP